VGCAAYFGESEVKHLQGPVGLDLYVAGLQVAVNHTLLVGRVECIRDLPRNCERFFQRNRPLRILESIVVGRRRQVRFEERLQRSGTERSVGGGHAVYWPRPSDLASFP
jgi:hypothetical protein